MTTERDELDEAARARLARGIVAVREGHGANCSSVGSVVDTLFATAVLGGAVFAAIAAALAKEDVRVVGARDESPADPSPPGAPPSPPPEP